MASSLSLGDVIKPYCNHVLSSDAATQASLQSDLITKLTAETLPAPAGYVLQHVEVLVRHGGRTPIEQGQCWTWTKAMNDLALDYRFVQDWQAPTTNVVNDFNKSPVFADTRDVPEPEGIMWDDLQLVREGAAQEDVNGQALFKTYFSDATKWSDITDQIYMRHTDYNRTRLSGMNLVNGLLRTMQPGDGGKIEVQMHSINTNDDVLLTYGMTEVNDVIDDMKKSPEYKTFLAGHDAAKSAFMKIVADTNKKHSTTYQIPWSGHARDCMLCQYCVNNGSVPDPLFPFDTNAFVDTYQKLNNELLYSFFWNNGKIAKMGIFDYVSQGIRRSVDTTQPKLYIATAHDNTIGYLLSALSGGNRELWKASIGTINNDKNDDHLNWVPYASMVQIETFKAASPAWALTAPPTEKVRFFVNGTNVTKYVKGCETATDLCDLNDYCVAVKAWAQRVASPALNCDNLLASTTTTSSTTLPSPTLPASSAWAVYGLSVMVVAISGLF